MRTTRITSPEPVPRRYRSVNMFYRIRSDEAVPDAVRRIAHQQTAEALDRLTDLNKDEAVLNIHDCRKRCKKVRGLVRLVRPALGGQYSVINRTYRDAARELSDYRDAQALLETFDSLVAQFTDRLPVRGFGPIRAELANRAQAASESAADDSEPVAKARQLIVKGRDRIDDWTLNDAGWDAIAGGLAKTYERGLGALADAKKEPTPHRYHELRKRAKYTWYQLRLLTDTAPSLLEPLGAAWHDLSDGLGDAHDLAVLRSQLLAEPEAFGGKDQVDVALVLLDDQRVLLEQGSAALAGRLYAERPTGFVERTAGHWKPLEE